MRWKRVVLLIGVAVSLVPLNAALASEPYRVLFPSILHRRYVGLHADLVAEFGGEANHVSLDDHYAYLGLASGVLMLDVSDPAAPVLLGRPEALQGVTDGLHTSGRSSVARYGHSGLVILDLSEPGQPAQVGEYELEQPPWPRAGRTIQDVALAGDLCYLVVMDCYMSTCTWGLRILDISDPAQPMPVGGAGGGFDHLQKIVVRDNHAFVVTGGTGLWVFDVADPTDVGVPSRCGLPSSNNDLAVDAGDGFVAVAGDHGLRVVDVSDPAHPELTAAYETPGNARSIVVSGTVAYVANDWGMSIFDLANLSEPVESGSYRTSAVGLDIAISGGLAYLAEGGDLRVLDVSKPAQPLEVSAYQTPGNAVALAYHAGWTYVLDAGKWLGLHVVDVSDPLQPLETGVCLVPTGTNPTDLDLGDGVAYVVTDQGLYVVDVSDPESPVELGACGLTSRMHTVVAVGDQAVAGGVGGLRVVDASDPAQPREVGAYFTPAEIHGLVAIGSTVYAASNSGLNIFDLSDPAYPAEIGSLSLVDGGRAIAVAGHVAYVAHGHWSITFADVTDPTRPTAIGHWQGYQVRAMGAAGDYLLLLDSNWALHIVNVSDPRNPVAGGALGRGGFDLAVGDDGYVYVAARGNGMRVVQLWHD